MKSYVFSILLATACLASLAQGGGNDFYQSLARADQRNASKLVKHSGGFTGSNYDLKYLRLEWQVDPDTLYIRGTVTSYLIKASPAVSPIQFELNDQMIVDSVIHQNKRVDFKHSGGKLSIPANGVIAPGVLDSLSVYYHGVPSNGAGSGSLIKQSHAGIPILWTLSEPFGASDWWPSKNDLSDKIDSIDIYVESPSAYRTASNGMLISEKLAGNNRVCHWKHRYPIASYLIGIAVTNYVSYSDWVPENGPPLQILNYVYPEDSGSIRLQSSQIIPVVQLFEKLFMRYPFSAERYGHAQWNNGGGMEHQTMTFINGSFSFELMSHELAHSWFGNKITTASWHDIWLNEGFASYCDGIALEHLPDRHWWDLWKRQNLSYVTSEPGGSVYVDDTSSVGRIFDSRLTYSKGALVLHSLRWILGDSVFFAGIRSYLNDPALAYAYAHNSDLKRNMEAACGCDLTAFFNDWYYGQGYPTYSISYAQKPDKSVGITISQKQSHPSVSFFAMPVPVKFFGEGRDSTLVFNNTYSGQIFDVNPGFLVDSLQFDPEHHIISAHNTVTSASGQNGQLEIYPNPCRNTVTVWQNNGNLDKAEAIAADGRIVRLSSNRISGNFTTLDISPLKAGAYILCLHLSHAIHYRKMLVY